MSNSISDKLSRRSSYTAASSYPIKVLLDNELNKSIRDEGRIIPVHMQLSPTNRCNLNCSWCSCSERDKRIELPYERIKKLFDIGEELGTKATTITGGGEPTLHPQISEMIRYADERDIKGGLVSNGLLLDRVDTDALRRLTWTRISFGDYRKFDGRFKEQMMDAVERAPKVDWAFSYVLANKEPNWDNLRDIVLFANRNDFTHVRFVSDLYNPDVVDMDYVRNKLRANGIDDHLVIYQGRKDWTSGTPNCLISLLKPIIDAHGGVYPCCGVQYAEANPSRDFSKTMRMGDIEDLPRIYREQRFFDGSNCIKCYYKDYNDILTTLQAGVKHGRFV